MKNVCIQNKFWIGNIMVMSQLLRYNLHIVRLNLMQTNRDYLA